MLLTLLFYALTVTRLHFGTWSYALTIFSIFFYFILSRQCWSSAWNKATVCPLNVLQFVIYNCTNILRYMNGMSGKYFKTNCKPIKTKKCDRLTQHTFVITKEMHSSYNQLFIPQFFCLLYMFRKNLVVHHQQHTIIYCITQFGTVGTIALSGECS